MKLATWNVALPVSNRRRTAMREHTDVVQADVWVLTEAHDGFTPGLPFSHSSAAGRDGTQSAEHHWVTIWSKYPIEPLQTSDQERAAAARIRPGFGDPFVVYGSVLPWTGSVWRTHHSAGGVAFRESLSVQTADWVRLRLAFPDDEFFVIGDLNQAMVGPPSYYGSRANRIALEAALDAAGLTALTSGAGDPVRRDSSPHACIDHICGRRDSKWHAESAARWPNVPRPERWLSDHFGLSIAFSSVPLSVESTCND